MSLPIVSPGPRRPARPRPLIRPRARAGAALSALLALLTAGCGGAPPVDLAPAHAGVVRLQSEARALAADSTSDAYLAVSVADKEAADRVPAKSADLALRELDQARAAALAAVASAVAHGRDAEAESCLTTAADSRRAWEDAIQVLEQTEKVAGHDARGVTRTAPVAPAPPGLPPVFPAPTDTVPPRRTPSGPRERRGRRRPPGAGSPRPTSRTGGPSFSASPPCPAWIPARGRARSGGRVGRLRPSAGGCGRRRRAAGAWTRRNARAPSPVTATPPSTPWWTWSGA